MSSLTATNIHLERRVATADANIGEIQVGCSSLLSSSCPCPICYLNATQQLVPQMDTYVCLLHCTQKSLTDSQSQLAVERKQSDSLSADVKAKQVSHSHIDSDNVLCLSPLHHRVLALKMTKRV